MSRRDRDPVHIQREDQAALSEEEQSNYRSRARAAIEAAKKRGAARKRPGDLADTPRFSELSDRDIQPLPHSAGAPPAPEELSEDTVRALRATAEATQASQPENPQTDIEETGLGSLSEFQNEEGEFDLEGLQQLFGVSRLTAVQIEKLLYPERSDDPQARLRQAIEARCSPIDIGQYIMNGFVTQRVPIIEPTDSHQGITVEFRTIPDSLEVFVDRALSEEASKTRTLRDNGQSFDVEMSNREYSRRGSEWALAAYVHAYQGRKWPSHLHEDGRVNEGAMHSRLGLVRQLPSHVFGLLATNLGWFLERSIKEINTAVLGNG